MTALPPDVVADLGQENARLRAELRAARERQTASAEILRAVAGAGGDAGRSLQQIAETTASLFGASSVSLLIADGERWGQTFRVGAGSERIASAIPLAHVAITTQFMPGAVYLENRQVHVPDTDDPAALARWPGATPARAAGTRTMSGTPLRREGGAIGALIVHRDRLEPFTDEELALQQSFADQAVIAIENARLFNETKEALERQTATAEILKVIASSPSDTTPVFEAIATSANRLLGGFSAAVFRFVEGRVHLTAFTPVSPAADAALQADFPRPVDAFEAFRLAQQGQPFPIPDTEEIPHAPIREIARLHGFRSMLYVPMMNGGVLIGIISVTRLKPGTFSSNHVLLLQTFADQAVIAIENTRLFNETKEALERQTATSDVLQAISESMADSAPVFESILDSCEKLLHFTSAAIVLIDGNQQLLQTVRGPGTRILRSLFPQPLDSTLEEAFRNRRPLYTANFAESAMTTDTLRLAAQKVGGYSLLQVPMFWQGRGIGAIYVSRLPNVAFSDKEVALLTTFADHAVIAIQNARLFNETKEALEQQKASADILSVISNSVADTQPVFDKILSSIEHLFGGDERFVLLAGEDDLLHIGAVHGPSAERARALFPVPLQGSASEVAMRERRLVAHADVFNDPDVPPVLRETARRFGSNYAMVVAPMLWEDRAIGSIFVGRTSMEPFGERECALLRTFADQAVIAIENARLFNETKEALERQTATADILKVIASSPSDVQPVFEAIAASSNRLIAGLSTAVHRVIDDALHLAAFTRTTPAGDAALQASFPRPLSSAAWGENIRNGETVHIPDVEIEWAGQPTLLEMARLRRFRSLLFVPLLRHGTTIGIISVSRKEAGTFAPQYVLLLQTFADQAVIAIENVRLFNETKEALERQTATADILKVIASSPSDVQPVFEAIAASANRLVGGFSSTVFRLIDGIAHLKAFTPTTPAADKVLQDTFPRPAVDFPPFRMAQAGEVTRIPDTDALSDAIGDIARARGFRSMLFAPLMNDGVSIGLIAVTRVQPSNFTDHHVQLLQTFADQAVIAIENVRLFEEVQARTRELSRSLDDLRTAQDRLVQTEKLASLGQLTAGIAHEIKNPLNFVNNFAALSAELTDELNEVLKPATLAGDIREEVDELTGLLKDNLQKVVQHGKRADSIVKNMLLHSREGSGEHRPADINALLDESLNLAYHGARAEKPQFNVTLQRDFDALAGMVELFPQEITRVFLNLISNGFYAVSKRKTDNGETDFEPLLFAATRSLGDTVEIRIRDNGTGIPAEVKEKMFNPFFTTKPAGEGTGLGLSMSHDIIVKQHGGRIEVETEPGQFTEFRIVLPRTSRIANKDRGQT